MVHEDGGRRKEVGLGGSEHQLLQRLGLRAHNLPREVEGRGVEGGEVGVVTEGECGVRRGAEVPPRPRYSVRV